jgi:hypothetical protein
MSSLHSLPAVAPTGDQVEEQQGVQTRCFAELEGHARFLASMAALKYGMWGVVLLIRAGQLAVVLHIPREWTV